MPISLLITSALQWKPPENCFSMVTYMETKGNNEERRDEKRVIAIAR
jgi:hypothetical protein